jgi:hypothetical protein
MTYYQPDFFAPPPQREPDLITQDNILVLVHPRLHPTGAEAQERMLARVREIEARREARATERKVLA